MNKLKKLRLILDTEYKYVYDSLLNTPKAYSGIGENHIDIQDDKECKGALKTIEFIKRHIIELEGEKDD